MEVMINRSLKLNAPSIWEEENSQTDGVKLGILSFAMGHKSTFSPLWRDCEMQHRTINWAGWEGPSFLDQGQQHFWDPRKEQDHSLMVPKT